MELRDKTVDELQARLAEIETEIDAEDANLDELTEETRAISDELEARAKAHAQKEEIRKAVANGDYDRVIESAPVMEARKEMDIKEFRNSKEYIDLYAEYMKSGDDTEIRAALLTTNAEEGGSIAVPDFVYGIIKTAWDKNDIMSLVTRANVKGNLVINFEVSGSPAEWHKEGAPAIEEEELVEGLIKVVPEYAKKWKSFSKQVLSMRGQAFIEYIYDEITYRIIKLLADQLISMIAELPQTATTEAVSAAKISGNPAFGTIASAVANLSDEATNPTVIMNKLTWSNFKEAQYKGNFAADIFEGLTVRFNNTLPAFDAASEGAVYMIVGDFREGTIANFPNGEGVEFTFDTLTRKKENLVEVLGELYVGLGVVADKAFTLVAKAASNNG